MGADPEHPVLDGHEKLPHLVVLVRREKFVGMLTEKRPQPAAQVSDDELVEVLALGHTLGTSWTCWIS